MNVSYFLDSAGKWTRREWSKQCDKKILLGDRCQGAKDHKGIHWCYSPNGNFVWCDNEKNPQHDGESGITPPDHHEYKHPKDMMKENYHAYSQVTDVIDPNIIAILEQGNTPEPNASINRPCTQQELDMLKREGRI